MRRRSGSVPRCSFTSSPLPVLSAISAISAVKPSALQLREEGRGEMRVLVIAPHPDDESIGCGGAVCLHVGQGNRVAVVFLTSGERGLTRLPPEEAQRVREGEAEAAAEILGLAALTFLRCPDGAVGEAIVAAADGLRAVLARETPERIYLPHPREWHPDHQASLPVLRAAMQGSGAPAPELVTYEVWTPLPEYDRVEDITGVMRRKLQAVRCHRSQLEDLRYDRAIRGLNQYRGLITLRCRYAEVFQSVFGD